MFKNKSKIVNKGFTLIEILVVIGLIAILAAIVLIAINPAKQFAQGRNSQRTSNVESILNAVGQRMADNKGIFAGLFTISGTDYKCAPLPAIVAGAVPTVDISDADSPDIVTASGLLGCLTPTYLPAMPTDPKGYTLPATGYKIGVDPVGRVTVCATDAAGETAIPNPANICLTR